MDRTSTSYKEETLPKADKQSVNVHTQPTSSLEDLGNCLSPNVLHGDDCNNTEADVAKMQELFQQNPDILEQKHHETSSTPLISAVRKCHFKCVKFLLEKGADTNAESGGHSVLSHAVIAYSKFCKDMCKKIIELLLQNGSDPNFVKVFQNSGTEAPILTFLIGANYEELIELFLLYGADPNVPVKSTGQEDSSNITNIIILKEIKDIKHTVLKLLLDYGGKINLYLYPGNTYTDIYTALNFGDVLSLKLLLLYNAPLEPEFYGVLDHSFYAYFIQNIRFDIKTKLQLLRVLHKFGLNLWHVRSQLLHGTEEEMMFADVFIVLRNAPLSLKCMSRNAIQRQMGSKFPKCYKLLELPSTLHDFLEYPDADM